MENQIIFVIATFLHDLATALWIGGLLTMGFIILPSTKKLIKSNKERQVLMEFMKKRMSLAVYISIPILLVTGLMLGNNSALYLGPLSLANTYSFITTIKHILYVSMVVITLLRSQIIGKWVKFKPPQQQKISAGLLFLNIGIGTAVLFLSATLASL